MSVDNVHCVPNNVAINAECRHIDGKTLNFVIKPFDALIDRAGRIRFFNLTWTDGVVTNYLLHPYYEREVDPRINKIVWALEFLGTYGLSRTRGKVVKIPKGTHPAMEEVVQLASYFAFNKMGGHLVRSFVADLYSTQKLGYHNILTDKLIWLDPIRTS